MYQVNVNFWDALNMRGNCSVWNKCQVTQICIPAYTDYQMQQVILSGSRVPYSWKELLSRGSTGFYSFRCNLS